MSRERSKHYISEGDGDNPFEGVWFVTLTGCFNTPHGSFDTLDEAVAVMATKRQAKQQRESQQEVAA